MENSIPTVNQAGKTIARNFHVIRLESEMSMRGLASATGLSDSTVRRAELAYRERRPYNPQLSTVIKMARATGLSVGDLATATLVRS